MLLIMKIENTSKTNLVSIWDKYLFFHINRSRKLLKLFGNANGYLIFQVICWHYALILKKSPEFDCKRNYGDNVINLWKKIGKEGFNNKTVLTYTLVSDLTGLSIETVRRQVLKLKKGKWVEYSVKSGIVLTPSEQNNKLLTDIFNAREVKAFGSFLNIIEKKREPNLDIMYTPPMGKHGQGYFVIHVSLLWLDNNHIYIFMYISYTKKKYKIRTKPYQFDNFKKTVVFDC